jgi:Fic family protein
MNFLNYTFEHLFVVESNRIDPQPGYDGTDPNDLMYKNQMSALEFVLSKDWNIGPHTPLDIHRELTRNIPFFEDSNNSGVYRNCDVYIGSDVCPKPYLLPDLMTNAWFYYTNKLMNESKLSPLEIALISHNIFEVIHPFIDGNGRTGRLIFNKVLTQMGDKPRVIFFIDRFKYYKEIQDFREHYFVNNTFVNLERFFDAV